MSPSESDLRAALHDGEGDVPDVDLLINRAGAHITQRRVRLLSAAAVVAVVASAGVGVGILTSGGDHAKNAAADNGAGGAHGARRAPVSTFSAAPPLANAYAGAGSVCPATTRSPSGSAGGVPTAMFSKPVSTVVICAYSRPVPTTPRTGSGAASSEPVVLSGAQAKLLVQSLKDAPTTRPRGMCPMMRMQARPITMIALGSDGTVLGTASTDLGVPVCNVVVVHGGATRYGWTIPAGIAPKLTHFTPVGSTPSARPTR